MLQNIFSSGVCSSVNVNTFYSRLFFTYSEISFHKNSTKLKADEIK